MSEVRLHVVTISPIQQVILRLALNDKFRKQCEEIIVRSATDGRSGVESSIDRYDELFSCYQSCTANLPSSTQKAQNRTKLLYLGPSAMRYMVDAMNAFNVEASSVDKDHHETLAGLVPGLRSLINTASEHNYTTEELKAAGIQ